MIPSLKELREQRWARSWAWPLLVLSLLSAGLFWSLFAVDLIALGDRSNLSEVWARFWDFDPLVMAQLPTALASVVAAVLGIVITVVSIVVQLSAARFTGITRTFLRDPANLIVVSYYVVVCVAGLWLSAGLRADYVPRVALMAMLICTALAVVLMVPYFGYVFSFLEPVNIIQRIYSDALAAAREGAEALVPGRVGQLQERTLLAMEELTDIASASISGKDKIIASRAVDALKDFALHYMPAKASAEEVWFRVGGEIAKNPDFVAMDPESLTALEERRTWVEWKVMRQYLGIYNDALGSMRDINYLIAIDTRYIGEGASQLGDGELIELVYRYMNSYLRATLNARDVRTAYNVMNQYRLLVESMIRAGKGQAALQGLRHMIYYGHVSYDLKLPFVTETVAYDVSTLCQIAHGQALAEEPEMLERFLELDRPLRAVSQETALIGVRKAQVKLAAYYLSRREVPRARTIFADLQDEPRSRLDAIREALCSVTTKDYWEIIDRGRNFEFMPEQQRQQLDVFFGWLREGPANEPTS